MYEIKPNCNFNKVEVGGVIHNIQAVIIYKSKKKINIKSNQKFVEIINLAFTL